VHEIPPSVHHVLTAFLWKLEFEDYESEQEDEAEEAEEHDSDNESFHEVFENLALEEKKQILIASA